MKQIESSTQRVREIFKARDLVTFITVLLSLYVTYNVWSSANQATDKAGQTTFDFRVRESNERIQQRLLVYEQVLRATVGLFRASTHVTRSDFRNYIEALDIAENYPGIQGIGYSIIVSAAEKDKHERMVRAEGFPEYRITPEGERAIYSSALYLEPFTEDNLRAFGYDMYSEPTRHEAMAMARDTAQPAMSGKVTLVQEGSNGHQSGFLVYLPVYRDGTPPELLAQRRENLVGWVYAPFRINHFMHGIQGENPEGTDDLDIEIYDGEIAQVNRMYDSDESGSAISMTRRLHSVNRIVSGQHTWTVVTSALPAFEQKTQSDRPGLVLRAGISISLLLGLLIWIFLDDRARALQAANQAMQLALYDPLTGLPNRKLLDERLERELARAKRDHDHVALLFLDLDKFKPVNDTYGHAYGDLLLKEVAKRLHSCMREADTASRLGGDEFVALLTEIEGKNAVTTVATKILKRLSDPYEISGHTFNISASIGAALYPEDGANPKALIKSADMAMYAAKDAGRGNVRFANQASGK